jgi:hypothetical protein
MKRRRKMQPRIAYTKVAPGAMKAMRGLEDGSSWFLVKRREKSFASVISVKQVLHD